MYREMWNPEMEALSPEDKTRLENGLLRKQIGYVAQTSAMYQRKWREAGADPAKVASAEGLASLPFTQKSELRQSQKLGPPFGDYLSCPPEQISRVHRTSGSTGKFIYTALTKADLAQTHDCGARSFWAAGLRPHHRVIHCLNYQLWMGGYTDHANLETTGAAVFPFGVGNSRQLVRVIQEAGITALSSTPSYPNHLAKVVRDELGLEPRELGLRLGLFGGEPGLDNPDYRGRIEETWGMRAMNANYGVSDVLCNFASVCRQNYQLHFLGTGALLMQLIDPISGEDIPIREGAVGEMVLTHLAKEAQPLVRYRTADLLEILGTGPCACGRTGPRFRVKGRADDMLHVKGINVFPNGIARVLWSLAPDVTGEFQVVLGTPPPHTGLDITVEKGPNIKPEEEEGLIRRITTGLKQELNFAARITLVPPDSIPRTQMGKARRVLRNYES